MHEAALEARADRLLAEGYHCSQCVFPYLAAQLGMDQAAALRLSAGLGGGCFHGDSCGAVTGAILALSMAYGFDAPDSGEQDEILIAQVHELERRFIAQTGSLLCRDLLGGYDKADPDVPIPDEAYQNCGRYCAIACRIADELLHAPAPRETPD